jgi:hypothetical protein
MAKYLTLFMDGCNGLRRGDVVEANLDKHPFVLNEEEELVRVFERNPGEGVYEAKSGDTWYVELERGPE